MTPVASFTDFSYAYPETKRVALDRLSLELESGSVLLCGPSGGGKSTLLRSLNGLVPHFHGGSYRGKVTILGHDLLSCAPRQLAREVAMVFQEPEAQFVLSTVGREVAFGPENLGLSKREVQLRTGEALEALGISQLRDCQIATLSGGQRQRVALAASVAMRPRLLLLDEPTSQLDPAGVESLRLACARLRELGISLVVAEQRPWRIQDQQSEVLWVEKGRVSTGSAPLEPEPRRPRRSKVLSDPAWETAELSVGHGFPLLEGLAISCRQGEVISLTGNNGSGKTTLLRTLAGLLRPLAGRVERHFDRSAYLPQEPGAVLHQPSLRLEVSQTIRWLRLKATPEPILESLDLASLAQTDPRDLSTGQRQRAALAAVLVGEPKIVFLDEPTRGIDPPSREALLQIIDQLAASGSAVLLATSDRHFAERVSDLVWEIDGGRLLSRTMAAA